MYNNSGQAQRQYQNGYMNNRLTSEYNRVVNNNVPYSNVQMLMNNPNFVANIRNSDFYTRMNLEKQEYMKKIKNVKDLGISEEQLTNYVICPIKLEKDDPSELAKKYSDKSGGYITFGSDKFKTNKKGYITTNSQNNIPEFIRQLWEKRDNNPYKAILKKELDNNKKKKFNKREDLVVEKITKLDKELIKVMKDYEDMIELIEELDGELRIKYSKKHENKYKEKFDHINKVKYSIKYDPKDYNQLKQFYKQQQKKIKKANKRVDEMIEVLLASETFTKDELADINKQNMDDHEEELNISFNKMDEKYEKELEKDLGLIDDELDKLIKENKELDKKLKDKKPKVAIAIKKSDSEKKEIKPNVITIKKVTRVTKDEDTKKKDSDVKPVKKVITVTKVKKEKSISSNSNKDYKPKKVISIQPIKKTTVNKQNEKEQKKSIPDIGHVSEEDMMKYKKKQKKI